MFSSIKNLPLNIWILAVTLSLAIAVVPLLVFVGGLLGAALAPHPELATLPLAVNVLGLASATVPAALVAKKYGRKQAGFLGLSITFFAALICSLSSVSSSFHLLLLGSFLIGCSASFYQQFRFAAIESLSDPGDSGPALSVIMLCSIVAGVLGPELGSWGKDLVDAPQPYAGSFLLAAGVVLIAAIFFTAFKNPTMEQEALEGAPRPLKKIVVQPVFLVSISASMVGYALMSFLMTSTPISMNIMQGHSLDDSKWVIQSHLVAMFLPSLFTGFLIKRFGPGLMMLLGSWLYLIVILAGTSGQHVIHYWWALVLLGVGWNFLFMSGTTLLPQSYNGKERYKTQAVNEFTVFAGQAVASMSAGWVLFQFGWRWQLISCLPVIFIMLSISIYYLLRKKLRPYHQTK